jgi:catechol 2,3-dioxygenase-like lactoylglutathione lyase family enzyme
MSTNKTKPRVTSLAPQFLVDDLARSIIYYEKLGFTFGEPWDGFYAIGQLDGLELHLKEAPRNDDERRQRHANEHLDAAAGVEGIEAFYAQCQENGERSLSHWRRLRGARRTFTSRTPMAIFSASEGGRLQTEWARWLWRTARTPHSKSLDARLGTCFSTSLLILLFRGFAHPRQNKR